MLPVRTLSGNILRTTTGVTRRNSAYEQGVQYSPGPDQRPLLSNSPTSGNHSPGADPQGRGTSLQGLGRGIAPHGLGRGISPQGLGRGLQYSTGPSNRPQLHGPNQPEQLGRGSGSQGFPDGTRVW